METLLSKERKFRRKAQIEALHIKEAIADGNLSVDCTRNKQVGLLMFSCSSGATTGAYPQLPNSPVL